MNIDELKTAIKKLSEHIVNVTEDREITIEDNRFFRIIKINIIFGKDIFDPWHGEKKNEAFNQNVQDKLVELISCFYQQFKGDYDFKVVITEQLKK